MHRTSCHTHVWIIMCLKNIHTNIHTVTFCVWLLFAAWARTQSGDGQVGKINASNGKVWEFRWTTPAFTLVYIGSGSNYLYGNISFTSYVALPICLPISAAIALGLLQIRWPKADPCAV